MGEFVGVDELLIGRPLPLKLLQRGFIDHGTLRLELVDVEIHHVDLPSLASLPPTLLWANETAFSLSGLAKIVGKRYTADGFRPGFGRGMVRSWLGLVC